MAPSRTDARAPGGCLRFAEAARKPGARGPGCAIEIPAAAMFRLGAACSAFMKRATPFCDAGGSASGGVAFAPVGNQAGPAGRRHPTRGGSRLEPKRPAGA